MILLRSYATLSELLNDLFGTHWALPIYSFGFFVALAFLAAAWVLLRELKRKEKEGVMKPEKVQVVTGKPATAFELVINALLGYILGFKIIGVALNYAVFVANPQQYIISLQGNLIGGIVGALLFAFLKWYEKNKQRTEKPETQEMNLFPHQLVGDMVTLAAIFGILGAKVFSNFEEPGGWNDFFVHPLDNFFSGLTIYGGLLFGAAAIIIYAVIKKINVLHLGDAIAPALILAYGIGRIGCQVAGDGDWGILNSAYITQSDGTIAAAAPDTLKTLLQENGEYYISEFGSLDDVPSAYFKAPSFIPRKFVAQSYAHNVNNEGQKMDNCNSNWYAQLPVPVFPTPVYETIMSLIIFFFLWAIRKKLKTPGMLLAIYVILNGVERFFIEKIRVNNILTFLGIHATQAEFISFGFIVFGLLFILFLQMRKKRSAVI